MIARVARTASPSRRTVILFCLIAGLAFALRILPSPRTIDDAFITFRYSRNIVEGHGFVYNLGTRTLGTTTPLFTLLMAAIGFVTGSDQYPWFALIVSACADAATAVLLAQIGLMVTRRLSVAALLGILWAVAPMSVTFAVGGMETSVAILWAVAATYAHYTRRRGWSGLFAGLGLLTRIDSILWVGPMLAYQLIKYRQFPKWVQPTTDTLVLSLPWSTWRNIALVVVPWYAFSCAYFDTLIPRSLSAKTLAYVVPDLSAFTRLLQHIATPFFENDTLGVAGIAIGLFLYPALALMGTLFAVKKHHYLLPYLVYPWLYVAVFSLMNPLIFRWYLAPILPAYFLAIVLGLWGLLDALADAVKRPALARYALVMVGLLWVGLSLNAWTLTPDHGPNRPAPKMAWHQIELYYREMGETLRDTYGVTGDTLVAAGDIGAVGYYSRARILDTVGLITPAASAYYPLDERLLVGDGNYAVPPAIIYDFEPAYAVFMEMFVRNGLAQESQFTDRYQEVKVIPTDFYGTGMILYQRRDLAGAG